MSAVPVLARTVKYSIRISQGENKGQVYSFEKPVVTVGRGPENDLVFANDPKISRAHLELRVQAGQLYARNISGKNFLLVDGERVEDKLLAQICRIQVGETVLEIEQQQSGQSDRKPSAPLALAPTASASPLVAKNQAPLASPRTNFPDTAMRMPPPPPPRSGSRRTADGGFLENPKAKFYLVLGLVIVVVAFLFNDESGTKARDTSLRTEGDILRAIEESANAVKELRDQKEKRGEDSLQYKAAQEHYVKGFRDYQQRQYARAMMSFQAALSFYPQHELARKYLVLSQRKFDETVDRHMSLGRKYYARKNYKMCQSSFANSMIMLKDSSKPKYKEAKQFYDECGLRMEGRF